MSTFFPLTLHLQSCKQAHVPIRFAEIEAILGFALPPSSRQHRGCWSNNLVNNVMTKAWLAAGFTKRNVDLVGEQVFFSETKAPMVWEGSSPKASLGDHPLFGCMAGSIRVDQGFDLTAPIYADAELESWLDEKASNLRGTSL